MYLTVCGHQSIVRQHNEIVCLEAFAVRRRHLEGNVNDFCERHQMMIRRSLFTSCLMQISIMNITYLHSRHFSIICENQHCLAITEKAEIHQYLCEIGRLSGNQHANLM